MRRRSKRQSAFCLEAGHPPHLAARVRGHPDALPPGPEGASPSGPCEPMWASIIMMMHVLLLALLARQPTAVSQSNDWQPNANHEYPGILVSGINDCGAATEQLIVPQSLTVELCTRLN